ncbi:hypothetical protein TrVE_jg7344 [Triparma verrucosa]|uniref:C2H2-type domain-containing protein n=1 Tax=Triparma verrucosa TaxID=1606542 RepID=A0A9W7BJT0_9STRA|nr:hypothetical protein TrVE_jg7344 [Triparma verrucosa]
MEALLSAVASEVSVKCEVVKEAVGKKRKANMNDVKRDKNGKIVKFCREEGCTFKTGDSTYMKRHQVSVHGFDFSCAGDGDKPPRDKWGAIIKSCGFPNCTFKTSVVTFMKQHRFTSHSLPPSLPPPPSGLTRSKNGSIIRPCPFPTCPYTTSNTGNLKSHLSAKHSIPILFKNPSSPTIERDKWGKKIKKCTHCPYKTGSTSNMKWHLASVHSINVKWYECDLCMYKAMHLGNLKEHKKRHREGFKIRKPKGEEEGGIKGEEEKKAMLCVEVT